MDSELKTPLYDAHVALGARMVPFAGYLMPVQYEGVKAEHLWTRENAGLFDVSHMGQAKVTGEGAKALLESLTPTDFDALKAGTQKYSLLLNDEGGILDDWMVSRPDQDGFFLVVNAACKAQDFAILNAAKPDNADITILSDRALLALQGPKAKEVMATLCPDACALYFMDCGTFTIFGQTAFVSRSGYTGEDGFEISFPAAQVSQLWDALLAHESVKPIGLGARDSLRLEAGMPLYGHEMDESYSVVESGLSFGMSKSRLDRGDIKGQARIAAQKGGEMARTRVGLKLLSGPPAREGAAILNAEGVAVGHVTSGVPSPSLGHFIAMGYVPLALSAVGTGLMVDIRGKSYPAEVVDMPFVKNGYHRRPKA